MDRCHRQERKKIRATHHREHIPEVGTRTHFYVFDDISKNLPAFHDAFLEHEQAFFQKDDIGGFFGDVDRSIDRDANVGCFHRKHVVDSVTHETNHMTRCAKSLDDFLLLIGREAGEHIGQFYFFRKSRVVLRS